MTDTLDKGVTPESLMESFKGVSAVKMIAITLIFHVVMIGSTSIPYLKKSVFGDTDKLTREEKIARAVEEATSAMRKIAADNGLNPQDISERFGAAGKGPAGEPKAAEGGRDAGTGGSANGAPGTTQATAGVAASVTGAAPDKAVPVPEKPKSAIEQQLEQKAQGPKVPGVGEKDDIF